MNKNRKWKRTLEPYIFLAPLLLIILVFLIVPIAKAAVMSFQYYYIAKPSPDGNYFVGLKNYQAVLTDDYFYNSVKVTLIYIVVTVLGRYVIGFITALLLNTRFLGRGLARALIIIPWAVPEVVACLVWILMYDRDYGIINFLLNNAGILSQNIAYLQDVSIALPAATVVNIWKGFPFVAVMLLAGMQSVSSDMYEAADIDGATWLQKVRYITIPSIKSVSTIVFLLLIIWTIKDYAIAYVLTKGGPSRATELLTIYVQQMGFKYFDFGKAAASGMLMLLVSLVFTYFYFKVVNRGEEEA
ncbi:MAG: sugar ABC transporter permease [Dorea sp.]|jgi:multiple sugar transport system permease protein|nr:sugar ABC transporter permease [Dorea sp.]GFI44125.1 inner membrane ABC transporter permease protein YcjO [Lachnospiraceae bacterium]